MKLLLDGRLAPTTSELGFVECDARQVAEWYARWLPGEKRASATQLDGGLEANLRALLPLTTPLRRRFLFQSTSSPWTAYFDNGARNTDAAGLSHVARELKCRAVRVVAIAPPRRALIWELYGPEPTEFLNYVRSISLVDGTLDVGGAPQPYEEPGRFDVALLTRYLEALGIRAFDEAFYARSGWLVERS